MARDPTQAFENFVVASTTRLRLEIGAAHGRAVAELQAEVRRLRMRLQDAEAPPDDGSDSSLSPKEERARGSASCSKWASPRASASSAGGIAAAKSPAPPAPPAAAPAELGGGPVAAAAAARAAPEAPAAHPFGVDLDDEDVEITEDLDSATESGPPSPRSQPSPVDPGASKGGPAKKVVRILPDPDHASLEARPERSVPEQKRQPISHGQRSRTTPVELDKEEQRNRAQEDAWEAARTAPQTPTRAESKGAKLLGADLVHGQEEDPAAPPNRRRERCHSAGSQQGRKSLVTGMLHAGLTATSMGLPGGGDSSVLAPWAVWCEITEGASQAPARENSARPRKSVHQQPDKWKKAKSADFHRRDELDTQMSWMLQALAVHPGSPKRLLWMVCGMLLITYDLIMVPLLLASSIEAQGVTLPLAWLAVSFWTLDFLMNFFVGYHWEGTLEMRPRHTSRRYIRTWMLADLALISMDSFALASTYQEQEAEDAQSRTAGVAVRFLRTVRVLRSVRLLRVIKLPAMVKQFTSLVGGGGRSEYLTLIAAILKHTFGILVINHVIACLWYYIGDQTQGWVYAYRLEEEGWLYVYLTALHWTLTQFTPASMSVQPQGVGERAFAVTVIIFALITFSSFVSSITNLMTHLRSLKSQEAKQFFKLERYLRDNQISYHLSLRVRRYLEHLISEQKKSPHERDIELLARVSEPLRMELHFEVYSPVLSTHPFFQHYTDLNLSAMQKLCHTAIRTIHLSSDDILFSGGDTAKAMSFVMRGRLNYTVGEAHTERTVTVPAGSWTCEMVLWTPWAYCGECCAATESLLMEVDAATFHGVVADSKAGQLEASAYAVTAVEVLSKDIEAGQRSDLEGGAFQSEAIAIKVFNLPTPERKPYGAKHWWGRGMTFGAGGDQRRSDANRGSTDSSTGAQMDGQNSLRSSDDNDGTKSAPSRQGTSHEAQNPSWMKSPRKTS